MENAAVAKRAFNIWPKIIAIVDYWHDLPKSKQPGKGDPKKNKSYHVLLQNHTNPLVPLYFKFFESIAAKLNGFLRRFQSDAPMVPFLVNILKEITREFCSKFILDEVMGNSTNTIQLIKIDVFDINKQKVNVDLGFAIKKEINLMKKNGKIKETKLMEFYKAIKKFLVTLCNHLLTKTPLQYQFARCCRCLNPHFMSENQSSSKKLFNVILEELVSSHHFTANQADNAKSQYANFLQTIVNRNGSSLNDFSVDESRLDEFLMSYLESCSRSPQLTEIAKFIMILSHGQSASERGFSTNKNLLVENLKKKVLNASELLLITCDLMAFNPMKFSLLKS